MGCLWKIIKSSLVLKKQYLLPGLTLWPIFPVLHSPLPKARHVAFIHSLIHPVHANGMLWSSSANGTA